MLDWKTAEAPDAALIEEMAREAIAALPPEFAGPAAQVVLRVEDFAAEDVLDELEIDDPLDLTGLYDGVPMTEKSASDPQHFPDTVWLFRRAILDEWAARGDVTLAELVTHVLIHEIGHHFGLSDEAIEAIEAAAD